MKRKKILITGANNGLGQDAAYTLARRGHTVFATAKTEENARALQKDALREGIELKIGKLDILNPEDRKKAAKFNPDVLITTAAVGESGPLAEIPPDKVRYNFEVNIFATLALVQEVAIKMAKRGSGRLIIFSSVAGKITFPYFGSYSMTKHALESMTDALRQELQHHGVFVSAIEPGPIGTGFNEKMNASKYEWFGDNSFFQKDIKRIKKFENMIVSGQLSTEGVTKGVVHAAEAKRPKTRYVRPKKFIFLVLLAQIVPDRVRDWFVRRKASV